MKKLVDGLFFSEKEVVPTQISNGLNIWSQALQNVIQGKMSRFFPHVVSKNGGWLFTLRENNTEIVSRTIPMNQFRGNLKEEFEEFQKSLDALFELTQDPSVEPNIKEAILGLRLPNPGFMPEAWRVLKNRDQKRLIVLWGYVKNNEDMNVATFIPSSVILPEEEAKNRKKVASFIPGNSRPYSKAIMYSLLLIVLLVALLFRIGMFLVGGGNPIPTTGNNGTFNNDVPTSSVSASGEETEKANAENGETPATEKAAAPSDENVVDFNKPTDSAISDEPGSDTISEKSEDDTISEKSGDDTISEKSEDSTRSDSGSRESTDLELDGKRKTPKNKKTSPNTKTVTRYQVTDNYSIEMTSKSETNGALCTFKIVSRTEITGPVTWWVDDVKLKTTKPVMTKRLTSGNHNISAEIQDLTSSDIPPKLGISVKIEAKK